MKKISFQMIIVLVLMAFSGFSQRPTIGLTFTAKYQSQHVMLDSIYIQNLTQPCDTMLFAPDTVFFLDYIISIPDGGGVVESSFSVSPNYPNPSIDGKTAIDVFIPKREIVAMRVFDVLGNEVASYEKTLDEGNHHFTFLAGKARYYVLSVNFGNEIRSIKMINSGNSNQSQGTLIYQGISETQQLLKSQEAITGFDFSLEDQLRFIGYSKSPSGINGSDVIEATIQGNEDFVFEILEGITCRDTPTVTYEGKVYNTVQIDYQCWFRENLDIGTMINGYQDQGNNYIIEKYCYDNNDSNCETYGGLYQWNEMMQYTAQVGAQGICPPGWHVPSDAVFSWLAGVLGGSGIAGGKMKEAGVLHWNSPNIDATNETGFTALPGGYRDYDGLFNSIGNQGWWWSSTEGYYDIAWNRIINYNSSDLTVDSDWETNGFSVRCVKNWPNTYLPSVTTNTVINITQTTSIGGGTVTDNGNAEVTSRGVCWSTSQNPTIADNHTSDGTGTGVFVSNLTGLTPGTSYFVRAYATNSVGTAYGNEVDFTTLSAVFTCGSSITVNHIAGEVAPVDKTVTYGTVTNIPGEPSKCWITSNLGADHQATAKDDAIEASAGWYWQFNRKQGYKHDGTTRTPNTVWINNIEENSDWIAENDPCALELGVGWRIPTSTEWQNVYSNGNWYDWDGPWNSGLKLHAAGLLGNNDGWLYDRGSSGLYWSNNQYSTTDGSSIDFSNGFCSMFNFQKAGGFSLRCIRSIFTCGDVVNYDGQNYNTVQIGTQCWFKENLNTGRMINGSQNQSNNGAIEKYCYDDDPANCDIYGGIYQWDEMMGYTTTAGVQGICPTGWHIPTDAEWTILTDYLGGEAVGGGAMKETGTLHWLVPNTGATNSSGFTALPAGYHSEYNFFGDLWGSTIFWSSTESDDYGAWLRRIYFDSEGVFQGYYTEETGFSVRCIKDN